MHCVMLGLRRAAANIAGGTHHAFPGHGEGFCEVPVASFQCSSFKSYQDIEQIFFKLTCRYVTGVFNDIAVAAHVALEAYSGSCTIERPILVIDLDVHQARTGIQWLLSAYSHVYYGFL